MSSMTLGIIVLVASFVIMLAMGVEITYTLGLSAVLTCLVMNIKLLVVFQTIFYKMANYSLLAVPCFMLMGEFMSMGSMALMEFQGHFIHMHLYLTRWKYLKVILEIHMCI